jgi:hypothetical protein
MPGWSSTGLPTVGDRADLWTVAEAASLLGPPDLNQTQVRSLIRMASLQPAGKRRTTCYGTPGRHARVYKADELIELYDTLLKSMEGRGLLGEADEPGLYELVER